jgi:RNA polymerase sigma factor (sigma-70 family)
MMPDDAQLLRQYTDEGSESAFGELVSRHLNLVYSAALRIVAGDAHLAKDVAQTVFSDFAQKARALPANVVLPGWLYRHACFTASKMVRTERRRVAREQIAIQMSNPLHQQETNWDQIAPLLDDAMSKLPAPDQEAIVLRFFQQQDFRSVGLALGVSEDTAQKRVSRSLEKLNVFLRQKGATLTVATLAGFFGGQAVVAAPAGLATAIAATAISGGVATGIAGSTNFILLKLMSITKVNIAMVSLASLAAGVLLFKTQQGSKWQTQVQSLEAQKQELADHVQELNLGQEANVRQLATLREENDRLSRNTSEILRLRAEVARLQSGNSAPGRASASNPSAENDPVYKGKSWSQWLAEVSYGQPQEAREAAAKALREIGPTIIPRLLLEMDPNKSSKIPNLKAADDRFMGATWAFKALGQAAKSAAPELQELFESNPGYALSAYTGVLGKDSLPGLTSALTNSNQAVRWNAAGSLREEFELGEAKEAIPFILSGLDDTNENVALQMRWTLQKLDPVALHDAQAK